ncbi:peptidase M16 [Arachidicoccus ginsenosidimutans]|uniref:M16 family metallopeptidase n=1 Tax=Arachidicoccus sp. BS20 TaxID=1850526 RepID=UPI0007F05E75|nr:pitrilysin family protein [Arachidicoccus sp. BS20]ANI89031.1 peptidase M16 [Arachidicoccus sp. BS20]
MLDRTIAPPIVDAVNFDIKLKPCEQFSLDNKTPVYLVNAGAEEVANIEFVFYAGNSFEKKNLVAASVNYLLKTGTKNKTAFEISEAFEFYGAHLSTFCSNEVSSIGVSCLSKHLPQLLPLISEVITESIFPETELSIYQQNQKQRLAINLQKGEFVAGRLIDAALYGKQHPYGKFTTAAGLDALSREDLINFYTENYTNGTCQIFAAGKLPNDIHEQLNKYFGSLDFKNNFNLVNQLNYSSNPSTEKKQIIINDESSVQGAIRIARNFPNRHSEDWQKVQVLNTIFGGYFGSRLMSNIREDKGYTYGIHSYLQNHIKESALIISTEAGKDVCEATIDEVWKEAKILREELIDEDELELVRNYMLGSILGSLDGPFQIINRWKSYVLNNLDETFFYKSIETIKTISAQALQDIANKYLTEDDFHQLTVF